MYLIPFLATNVCIYVALHIFRENYINFFIDNFVYNGTRVQCYVKIKYFSFNHRKIIHI